MAGRRKATRSLFPYLMADGLSIGQLAEEWRTTTDWVRSQISSDRLTIEPNGRILLASRVTFMHAQPETFEARPYHG